MVLTTSKNLDVLYNGVSGLCKAKSLNVNDNDIRVSIEQQVKIAIEKNIAGTRYLTNKDQLSAINMHIAMRAFYDLKEFKSRSTLEEAILQKPTNSIQDVQEEKGDTGAILRNRRREVNISDRSFLVEKVDDNERRAAHVIYQPTPRQLLR
jgi:hypothetical protein